MQCWQNIADIHRKAAATSCKSHCNRNVSQFDKQYATGPASLNTETENASFPATTNVIRRKIPSLECGQKVAEI